MDISTSLQIPFAKKNNDNNADVSKISAFQYTNQQNSKNITINFNSVSSNTELFFYGSIILSYISILSSNDYKCIPEQFFDADLR